MPAGKYRDRVSIEEPTRAEADDGQTSSAWTLYERLWGNLAMRAGDQRGEHGGKQQQAGIALVLELRSSPRSRQITTKMRVLIDDRTLHIASVDRDSSLTEVVLTLSEKPL